MQLGTWNPQPGTYHGVVVFTDAFNVGETRAHRALYASLAIALAVAFAILNAPFRVPAHPGVDQMSYLVGGRLLAEHGSTTFHALNPVTHQPDPFRFTGRMWVSMDAGTPNERYHPLHPLGYATTIRYTEGLMLLPVLVVMGLRAHRERTARDTLLPLAAWAVPVVAVLLFNQITIGTWTGYRSGRNLDFGWTFFRTNWAIVFHLLSSEGLFLVFPLALAGLPLMFRRNARLALVLAAWILPNAALYTSYYWLPTTSATCATSSRSSPPCSSAPSGGFRPRWKLSRREPPPPSPSAPSPCSPLPPACTADWQTPRRIAQRIPLSNSARQTCSPRRPRGRWSSRRTWDCSTTCSWPAITRSTTSRR